MKNTVKNHVKVLDVTDSVDKGCKTGLESHQAGWCQGNLQTKRRQDSKESEKSIKTK